MRRWAALALFGLAGCTNAPIAGFLDLVHPVHIRDARDPERGGGEPFGPVNPPPPPPSGGQLLPPATPPAATPGTPFVPGASSGFSPRDNEPLPPPASRPAAPVGPLTLPNS